MIEISHKWEKREDGWVLYFHVEQEDYAPLCSEDNKIALIEGLEANVKAMFGGRDLKEIQTYIKRNL